LPKIEEKDGETMEKKEKYKNGIKRKRKKIRDNVQNTTLKT
jgi:hypothetical protein